MAVEQGSDGKHELEPDPLFDKMRLDDKVMKAAQAAGQIRHDNSLVAKVVKILGTPIRWLGY